MKVSTSYQGDMRYAYGDGDERVVMDASEQVGGRGVALTPKQMVLQGLIGCTGMDVAAILGKKGIQFEELTIDAEATQTKTHPKIFEEIKLVFHVKASEEDRPHVERAIKLSQNRFCGVSEMLKKSAQIAWELDLRPL